MGKIEQFSDLVGKTIVSFDKSDSDYFRVLTPA